MQRLKTLIIPFKDQRTPWLDDIIALVKPRHDIALLDKHKPLAPQFKGVQVVIDQGGWGTREMIEAAVDARLWQIVGTGFDHFDLAYCKTKKIPICNCPGQFSSIPLAETAMMFILMLSRQFRRSENNFFSKVLYEPLGRELCGLKLGIIGLGASGIELALRAKPFGLSILGIDIRRPPAEVLKRFEPEFIGAPDALDQVISQSDFVSLHLHLNEKTRHIIDARRIALMKPDACLINVARGQLVDETALYRALSEGKIGGAGLDVFTTEPPDSTLPVYRLPNVVVTPHIAAMTNGTSRRRAECTAQNIDRVAQGQEPLYRVDQ